MLEGFSSEFVFNSILLSIQSTDIKKFKVELKRKFSFSLFFPITLFKVLTFFFL